MLAKMNKSQSRIRCALYVRVSTRNQLEPEYNSLQTQREKLEAYCKSQEGFEVCEVYEESAQSAETLARPALRQLVRDIQIGNIDCVLTYKIDRLTRSVRDFHELMDMFEQNGVKYISITQSFDTQSPMGRLMRNILLDFGEFEREMTADRTRDKMHQRAQKGLWNGGIPPYGYKNENKQLIIDSDEAEIIRLMYRQYDLEPSISKIRSELQLKGITQRSGKPWGKTTISYSLSNPVYIGKIRFKGELYDGIHTPIIDKELFNRVQRKTPDRKHAKSRIKRTYLLKGLLKCGECGSVMTPHYTKKRRKDGSVHLIYYYRCTKAVLYGKSVCSIKHVNALKIEDAVIEDISSLADEGSVLEATLSELNKDLTRQSEPLRKEARYVKQAISDIEDQISNYIKALGRAEVSLEFVEQEVQKSKGELEELRQKLTDIEARLAASDTSEFNSELVRRSLLNFSAVFEYLKPPEKVEALQCVLDSVVLEKNRVILNIFELPEFKPGSQNRTKWLPLISKFRTRHSHIKMALGEL